MAVRLSVVDVPVSSGASWRRPMAAVASGSALTVTCAVAEAVEPSAAVIVYVNESGPL